MTLFKDKYRSETTRLRGWDYASTGWYFVTICTRNRRPFLGQVIGGEMHLSSIGVIAADYWLQIPNHTVGMVDLDAFVIMPNHVHGIIVIHDRSDQEVAGVGDVGDNADVGNVGDNADVGSFAAVGTLHCNVPTAANDSPIVPNPMARISPRAGSLGAIIRSYKSAVSRWCNQNGHPEFGWQARFYDHIIRNERALNRIRNYIINNPLRWHYDRYF